MSRYLHGLVLLYFLSPGPLSAEPSKVMIIRHAEKPEEGHCLSLDGWQRAAALVPFFLGVRSDGCEPLTGFGTPVAIYAQKPTPEHKSLRPMQTVAGLATALRINVKLVAHDDYRDMVREVQATPAYDGKTVLICWEHHAIQDLAAEFGVSNPPDFPGQFDRVWVITFRNGKAGLKDVPQRLMYGDSEE